MVLTFHSRKADCSQKKLFSKNSPKLEPRSHRHSSQLLDKAHSHVDHLKKSLQWTVHTRTCALKHLYLHKNLIMSTFTVNRSYKCDPWGRQIQANRPHNNPFGSFHKILTRKCLKLLPKWYRCWLAFHDKDVLYQVLEHNSLCFNQCQLLTIRLFTYIAKADRYSILFIARYFQISLKRH